MYIDDYVFTYQLAKVSSGYILDTEKEGVLDSIKTLNKLKMDPGHNYRIAIVHQGYEAAVFRVSAKDIYFYVTYATCWTNYHGKDYVSCVKAFERASPNLMKEEKVKKLMEALKC